MESIDQCLHRDLINKEQHHVGIKLRKLHDALFGAATIRAYDFTRTSGRSCRKINELQLQMQHQEYSHITQLLSKSGAWQLVSNVCIYQSPISFLSNSGSYLEQNKDLATLQDGLDTLVDYFKKQQRRATRPLGNRFRKINRLIESLGLTVSQR